MTAVLPSWHALALCRTELDPEAFFSDNPVLVGMAKGVCGRCEVREVCLRDAVARDEQWGVYGGLTATERMAPLLLADPEPPPHVASRGHYVQGCRKPDCCAANTAYQADLRGRAPATHASRVDSGEQLALVLEAS